MMLILIHSFKSYFFYNFLTFPMLNQINDYQEDTINKLYIFILVY